MQHGAGRLHRRATMPGRNPDPRGYYALLRVSPEATRQEIGRAFRALMRRRHPDVGHSGAGAAGPAGADADLRNDNVDVRAILDAFTVLRDPRTRADYDAGASQAVGQGGTNHSDTDSAGTDSPGTDSAGTDSAAAGGRDIPVRIIRGRDPLVRVLPVRWEPGHWPGKHLRGGP